MYQNQNSAGGAPAQSPFGKTGDGSPTWIIIGFVALLILALSWWVMGRQNGIMEQQVPAVNTSTLPENPEDVPVGAGDTTQAAISAQGSSDELSDIEADLNGTDMGALDGIDQI